MNSRKAIRNKWTKQWRKDHPAKAKASQYKSYTKSFILKLASKKDLDKIQKLVDQARKEN